MRPRVVILCGGRGTRLQERTRSIPKPMVEIGGRPVLWHVLQIYLAQGFRRALLKAHRGHGPTATMRVVRPELPFGVVHLDTCKGAVTLNELWERGAAPWKLWA